MHRHGADLLRELELPAEQETEGHGELAVHKYAQVGGRGTHTTHEPK